jgi:hypothetical protein
MDQEVSYLLSTINQVTQELFEVRLDFCFNETYSAVSNREPIHEASLPSIISYMDTLNFPSRYAHDSNAFADPADMFTPYVSYVSPFLKVRENQKKGDRQKTHPVVRFVL